MSLTKTFQNIVVVLVLCILFSSCSYRHYLNLRKAGHFDSKPQTYVDSIAFLYHRNHIIIPIQIEGNTYHFLFDTGMEISLIDSSYANHFNFSKAGKLKVSDSGNRSSKIPVVTLDSIIIAGATFNKFSTLLANINPIRAIHSCNLDIIGILGNDVMHHFAWKINFQEQIMSFSPSLKHLLVEKSDYQMIEMICEGEGNAKIAAALAGVKKNFIFDTGYTGSFTGSSKYLEELNKNKGYQNKKLHRSGLSSIGLLGSVSGVTTYLIVDSLMLDDNLMVSTQIHLQPGHKFLIGNQFLGKFQSIVFDWESCRLYVEKQPKDYSFNFSRFQYSIYADINQQKLHLGIKWLEHPILFDVSSDNTIISIEGIELQNMNKMEFCKFVNQQLPKLKTKEELNLTISEGGKLRSIILTKANLVPK